MRDKLFIKVFSAVMLAVYLLSITGITVHSCSHSKTNITFLADNSSKGTCKGCCKASTKTPENYRGMTISKTKCCSEDSSVLEFSGSTSDNSVRHDTGSSIVAILLPSLTDFYRIVDFKSTISDTSPPGIVQQISSANLCIWRS